MPTRSPSLSSFTPLPSWTTRPIPSWPGTKGRWGFTGQSPSAAWTSVWHTPQASTFTSTWPSLTSGTGSSPMVSGLPNCVTNAAVMVLDMLVLLAFDIHQVPSASRPRRALCGARDDGCLVHAEPPQVESTVGSLANQLFRRRQTAEHRVWLLDHVLEAAEAALHPSTE